MGCLLRALPMERVTDLPTPRIVLATQIITGVYATVALQDTTALSAFPARCAGPMGRVVMAYLAQGCAPATQGFMATVVCDAPHVCMGGV